MTRQQAPLRYVLHFARVAGILTFNTASIHT
jgi:hypothetical protein